MASFTHVFFERRRTRRFDILPEFANAQVHSAANQKVTGCFAIVSSPAATTCKCITKH